MNFFKIIVYPLSIIYAFIARLRNFLYDYRLLGSTKIETFTICIGNITVGGTGKTPVLITLTNYLKAKNYKVCVLSRGYKRKSKGLYLVSDYDQIQGQQQLSGDEPYLIAEKTKVPVVCCADRIEGARYLEKKFSPDIIILDDGFQHRKLKKDLCILLVDSPRFLGNNCFLPTGILRDNKYRLTESDLILLTKISRNQEKTRSQLNSLKRYNEHVVTGEFNNQFIYNVNERISLKSLSTKKIYFFAALGNPYKIIDDLRNYTDIKYRLFPDHYDYTKKDIKILISEKIKTQADYLVTTEKDYVKIRNFCSEEQIYILDLEVVFYRSNSEKLDLGVYIEENYKEYCKNAE